VFFVVVVVVVVFKEEELHFVSSDFLRAGPHYCGAFFTYLQNNIYTDFKLLTSMLKKI